MLQYSINTKLSTSKKDQIKEKMKIENSRETRLKRNVKGWNASSADAEESLGVFLFCLSSLMLLILMS